MKIDIWYDVVCPFCYLGEQRLDRALKELGLHEEVELSFKSFELNPNQPVYAGEKIHESLANKYRIGLDEAKQMNANVAAQAKDLGLHFDFDQMKQTNTLDAHRLTKYAIEEGKGKEMVTRLFSAYFEKGQLVSDHEVLLDLAEEVGLDREATAKVIADKTAYYDLVREEESLASQLGITSVPFFVINNKYAIKGAQPVETFVASLEKIRTEDFTGKPL